MAIETIVRRIPDGWGRWLTVDIPARAAIRLLEHDVDPITDLLCQIPVMRDIVDADPADVSPGSSVSQQ